MRKVGDDDGCMSREGGGLRSLLVEREKIRGMKTEKQWL